MSYYQYANNIDANTPDYKAIDMPQDVWEIYDIASNILKADISNQYGKIYLNRIDIKK